MKKPVHGASWLPSNLTTADLWIAFILLAACAFAVIWFLHWFFIV